MLALKLLVTGGAGFIGSNFIRQWLQSRQHDLIINLDLLTYAGDRSSLRDVELANPGRHLFIQGDIADAALVSGIFAEHRPEVVVNFAAESHNSRAVLDPSRFVRANVVGTQVLLEAARQSGIQRFHHVSTCEVYGDLPLDASSSFTEESPYRPRTPYSASKAAADHLVRAYHATFDLPTTISNCANNYGPYQFPEKLIPLFTTDALDQRPMQLYEHSENMREWVHVEDHCRAIAAILERGEVGETYNVGTGDERTIEQIADALLDLLGGPRSLKTYVKDRPGHDRRYLLDTSKIRRHLGWRPVVPFEKGLAMTVQWYAANREWWQPKKANLDVNERQWV